MKFVKYTLFALGAVLLLAVALAAYVAATFNPNDYKPEIIKLVKEKKQRTLAMPGDIKLSFFPKIGVELGKTSLSEQGADKEFAALEHMRLSFAVMPLLAKQLVVDQIALDGARANIVRFKDGSTNMDDLLGKQEKAAPPQAPGKIAFDVDGVSITNSEVSVLDQKAGQAFSVANFNLKTGRLSDRANGNLALSATVAGQAPKVNATVEVSGKYNYDLNQMDFGFSGLQSKIRGDGFGFSGAKAELQGDVEIAVAKQLINAAALTLAAAGAYGGHAFDAKLSSAKLQADLANHRIDAENLTANATGKAGAAEISEFKLDAPKLQADPQTRQLAVQGLSLKASGRYQGDSFDAHVSAPKLAVSKEGAGGDAVNAELKLSGTRSLDAKLEMTGVQGAKGAVNVAKLNLDFDAKEGERALQGNLSGPLSANLDAQSFSLPKLAAQITVTDPAIPQKTVKLPIDGAVHADFSKQTASAEFSTRFDESSIQAKLSAVKFAAPNIGFDIAIDKLNVDQYLPPKAAGAKSAQPPQPEKPFDLSPLKSVNAAGALKIGALQVSNIKTTNLRLEMKLAGGKLDINPLAANLYQGSVNGQMSANANNNQFSVKQNLTDVSVGPLLKDAASKDVLDGRGNVALDLTAAGNTPGALKKSLNGTAKVALKDGAIKGIDLAKTFRNVKGKLGGSVDQASNKEDKTDFSEMTASAVIKNGVAHNDDLLAKSPFIRISGSGDVNLGDDSINYVAKASVVNTSGGQGGKELAQLNGLTVPVDVTGPLDNPKYRLDFSGMVSQAAKQQIEQKKEEIKSKAQDQLKDQLKGLFGK